MHQTQRYPWWTRFLGRRFGRRSGGRGARRAATVALGLVAGMLALAACGGGAPATDSTPTPLAIDLQIGDGWIDGPRVEGGGMAATLARVTIPAHTELTVHLTNTGSVPHALHLYADAESRGLILEAPALDPGQDAMLRHHFHDPQVVYLRDGGPAGPLIGELHVVPDD